MSALRILLVEDDVGIGRMLERGLIASGHQVDWTRSLSEGVAMAGQLAHDVVVLDRMLPDGDGADLCAALTKFSHPARVCMLTARDTLEDKLKGFDAGADDYIVKPFEFEELLARIQVLGRRPPSSTPQLRSDPDTRHLSLGAVQVKLTKREWSLVQRLMESAGETVSRDELIAAGWGGPETVTENALDVYIGYLRRKLTAFDGAVRIETTRGEGYRLL